MATSNSALMKKTEKETEITNQVMECPKEHDVMKELISKIPKKAQKGLLATTCDLVLVCMDANEKYVALGTNVGLIFLFDRKKQTMERLKTESNNDTVTAVSIHDGYDDQLAAGTLKGVLYLFQLPSILPGKNKQLQQFVVRDLHKARITCLCWSMNGMKMYSGDEKGVVVYTQTDFYQKQCESSKLLTEPDSQIVQLHHGHKSLLVSTRHRSVIYRTDQSVVQVGQKVRKVLGTFGACFIPAMCKPDDAQLYASRPGQRIWKASVDGSVLNTFLFKAQLSQPHTEVTLLPYNAQGLSHTRPSEPQFGVVLLYQEKYLVTYSETSLYLLNPEAADESKTVIGSQPRMGVILQVAVTGDEIFVLRKNTSSNLVRLALKPELKPENIYQKLLKEREMAAAASDADTAEDHQGEDKKHKSPLQFIQTNVIDKIKNLDKPHRVNSVSNLFSSIDKFAPHGSGHDTDIGEEINMPLSNDSKESSPSKDLPPIVKLPSTDLLTIEVFTSLPPSETNIPQQDAENLSPGGTRINPFLRDQANWIEEQKLEGSDEVNTGPDFMEHREMSEKDKAVKPTFLIEKLDQAMANPDQDTSIVFAPKQKKPKKKKKGQKNEGSVSPSPKHKLLNEDHGKNKENDELQAEQDDAIHLETEAVTDPSQQDNIQEENSSENKELLYMDEPEDAEKFAKMTASLEDFEKTLSDLPPSSINETNHEVDNSESLEQGDITVKSSESLEQGDTKSSECISETIPVADDSKFEESEKTESSEIQNPIEISVTENLIYKDKDLKYETPSETNDNKDLSDLKVDLLRQESNSDTEDSIYSPKKPKQHLQNLEKVGENLFSQNQQKLDYLSPDSSVDDIYKKYGSLESTPSPVYDKSHSLSTEPNNSEVWEEEEDKFQVSGPSPDIPSMKTANNWTETFTSGNLCSMVLSNTHVWIVDKSGNIYYSSLLGTGLKWQKVSESAKQISVSRSGHLIWRLYRETIYAGTKITPRRPEGMKWVEAVRNVQYISVDENCAWYIKTNGDVMMQKNLSRERPCYRSIKVECPHILKQIVCQGGVVWGVTEECKLVYRDGITKELLEGESWKPSDIAASEMLFSCVTFGEANTGWALDVLGSIWFTTNVTMETPMGEECWWQVPISNMLVQDVTALDHLRSLAQKFDPVKLAYIMSTQRGGILAAGSGGVWLCPDYKNMLQICRGCIEGHNWSEVHMIGITSSIAWKLLAASSVDYDNGLLWCCQPNGDLFTYLPRAGKCKTVDRPSQRKLIKCLSLCKEAAWVLTDTGNVFIRQGMGPHCPQGAGWVDLDLAQLGDVQFISLSCGKQNVWAVDVESTVYQRIGNKAPSSHSLIQAWLPVDSAPTGTAFIHIISGPQDWMVWTIDNRRQVYTRVGITDTMPIGTSWVHVPGTQALQLTISDNYVWALNTSGEILCRYGVTPDNPGGDYWRKIPGVFTQISASPSDKLWGISREGQIYRRKTKYLIRRELSNDPLLQNPRGRSSMSSDDGWELV